MRKMHTLAMILLATGCFNPFAPGPDPTLEIWAPGGEHELRWPRDDTTWVVVRQRYDDPRGFAGLEIVIDGDNMPRRVYTAAHLANDPQPKFKVPETGFATVTARIVQDGRIVAEVSERWGLAPKIQWTLDVDRAPWPANNGIPADVERPECQWFWCAFVWRSPIEDDAANYVDEALWLTLYRHHPDECMDVC